MKVKTFIVNPFQMNCYIYFNENSGEGVIIDPAASDEDEQNEIDDFVKMNNIHIIYIINTHGHIDHIMGNAWAKKTFSAPVLINKNDLNLVEKVTEQGAMFELDVQKQPVPDKFINDDDIIEFDDCKMKVLLSPGHSQGSICLIDEINKIIFSGDTLFKESIGRTDLPGGDYDTLIKSIKEKLLIYPDDYVLYPGHMELTTIGDEKKNNPFLNGLYKKT